jgi:hypothetical protein
MILHGGGHRVCGPTACGTTVVTTRRTKGGCKLDVGRAYAGSGLKPLTTQEGTAWKASLPAVLGKTRRTE